MYDGLHPDERVVSLVRSPVASYGDLPESESAPEFPNRRVSTVAELAIRQLLHTWGLDASRAGTPAWNPLSVFIRPGARVVLKPNLVAHHNQSGHSLDCLITHASVIEAVLRYVALASPSAVVVGDAPIQGCDFAALLKTSGLQSVIDRARADGLPVSLLDFRRTIRAGDALGDAQQQGRRDLANYVLFDLAKESLLETHARDAGKFRVTMYNPDLLHRTHAPGCHQYLIAREILEADVVINLPKLKSHKKSCITGALKNLVGINGNKEFLPHHRKGGSASGGDCYPGRSWFKAQAEDLLDAANRSQSAAVQRILGRCAQVAVRLAQAFGQDSNLEGSWYGNDTVWRTCLDLQRILHYGCVNGTLEREKCRLVLTITDSIVAGEGEGPLANTPVPAGFLTAGSNPAAVEWVNARLMGFDPSRIPLTRHAFDDFSYPIATFRPETILVRQLDGEGPAGEVFPFGSPFLPPAGWRGHCELVNAPDETSRRHPLVA